MNNIGEKLYTLRSEKNMSQETLAELVDVSRQAVSKWETGRSVPELDKLFRLCDIFGVTLDELTGRTNVTDATDSAVTANPDRPHTENMRDLLDSVLPLIVGTLNLLLATVLFVLLNLFEGIYSALLITMPLFVCGIVCIAFRRRILLTYSVFLYFYFTLFYLWGYGVVSNVTPCAVGGVGAAVSLLYFTLKSIKTLLFNIRKRVRGVIGIVLWCLYALALFLVITLSPDIFKIIFDARGISDMSFESYGDVMLGAVAFVSAVKCAVFCLCRDGNIKFV